MLLCKLLFDLYAESSFFLFPYSFSFFSYSYLSSRFWKSQKFAAKLYDLLKSKEGGCQEQGEWGVVYLEDFQEGIQKFQCLLVGKKAL